MNTPIFQSMAKILAARRPAWTFVIEDNTVRIQTGQVVVKWDIIEEILGNKDLRIEEVMMQQALGVVITITYVAGV